MTSPRWLVSPGFLGDRTVATIGSNAGGTFLLLIQISDVAPLATLLPTPGAVLVEVTATIGNSPMDFGSSIIASDIALPSDWDPTTTAGRRTFLSWQANGTTKFDDVYRVDNSTVRKLPSGTPAVNGVWSIAYNGTISGGTLVAGEAAATGNFVQTWHTEDPNVSQPSWTSTAKSPTGTSHAVVGIDQADPMLVYAGTTGAESAFSVSENGATSFNQRSLIDTTIATINDVMPSPDGSVVFLATNDGTDASLWKSAVPTSAGSWERVRLRSAATGYNVRLSPEWDATPALYYFNAGGTDIQKSTTGGDIFSTRTAPVNIGDIAVENADILYLGDSASDNIYSSTNGAWFFGLPVASGTAGPVVNIIMAPSYPAMPIPGYVLATGVGAPMPVYSPGAGGAFFIPFSPSVPGGGNILLYAGPDFGNTKIVYGADAGGTGIWRRDLDTSTVWELISPAQATGGIAMQNGVLYGSSTVAAAGVLRQLYPTIDVSGMTWQVLNIGSGTFAAAPNALRVAGVDTNVLWAINTAANTLMAFVDDLATLTTDVNVPDVVPIDSVSGRSQMFTISWAQVSNSNVYDVGIFSDPAGTQLVWWPGAPVGAWPPAWAPSSPVSPSWVVPVGTLVSGQDYFVRARSANQTTGEANLSAWSSMRRFSVEGGERVLVSYLGVQPLGPVPGATGVPLSPGFTWSTYASSTRYEFQLASDAGFSNILAETKTSATGYAYEGKLSNATTYFWRARGIEPTVSDWSPVSSFSTEKVTTPPIVVEPPLPPPPAPASPVTSAIIWVIIGIGVILVIAVLVLIAKTRGATR